jgi:lysophospholipase L1-like esterase
VLEQIIRERLHPSRPVQVINAGVWAYSLADNLSRIASDILPLQPDMIISYHGYNGFPFLDNTLAPVLQSDPPRFIARPVFLLARVEHRLRALFFMRQVNHKNMSDNVAKNKLSHPLESEYARLYGQLVEVAWTNHVRLVLANFNLAVNELSHPDIIEFYRLAFPQVHEAIRANEAHSRLLTQLSLKYPEIAVIDVQRNLYGQNSQFIDLVHFTQSGRDQLATNVFDGIQAILKAGLNLPNL